MKVSRLKLDKSILDFLKSQGFTDLYLPQAAAIRAGLLRGKSVLVSTPTASGKTLVATMAILKYLSGGRGKAIYLSPLRALAFEKYYEFKKTESIAMENPVRVSISTGDFTSSRRLGAGNLLVMTNEKLDAITRNTPGWLDDIGLVVVDEIHILGDQSRGPTLEMVLSRLRSLPSRPQIVGLSATITNAEEIARWLGCNLVEDDWRPVPLAEGICASGSVEMHGADSFEIRPSSLGLAADLAIHSVSSGGQSIIFAETRRRAASLARKSAAPVSKLLDKEETRRLATLSRRILAKSEHTKMVKDLATIMQSGAGFHHAGLDKNCREIVEEGFRAGIIKVIASTPTLAAGVNLPARRVIIASIDRYDFRTGINTPISVTEYKQLCGRAGRPQYDTYGEAIAVVRSTSMIPEATERYIDGMPEPITSGLGGERPLRIHALGMISSRPGIRRDDLFAFFADTLAGWQSGRLASPQITAQTRGNYTYYSASRIPDLELSLDLALDFLADNALIKEKDDKYAATPLGRRISRIYIDPMAAVQFCDVLRATHTGRGSDVAFLQMICRSDEFFPKFALRQSDESNLANDIDRYLPAAYSESIHMCGRSILALNSWINEATDLHLSDKLGVEAGDMHRMIETADWLLYCIRELAGEIHRGDLLERVDVLRQRVKFGIRADLLELVRIRGIGRVRARALYKNNIRSAADLQKTPLARLAKISKIGPSIAKSLKSQTRGAR